MFFVQNPDAWAIMGHVKYLVGETEIAKHCYERTLAFVSDASEMHSIYLRLASIYLQESKVSDSHGNMSKLYLITLQWYFTEKVEWERN